MLRQSYDNYIQKEHNKLYQAVTQGSSIFFQQTLVVGSFIFTVLGKNVMNFLFKLGFFNNFVTIYIRAKYRISSFLWLCFGQKGQLS
ncbi:hypothetical protein B9T29_03635 [Acinetobacter sp. ANC 3903]|nr:hypothetical protein B9T29_03635 [Acinetobacter sp. ANC 3903]